MKNKEFIVTDMNVKEYTKKIAEWIKNQVKNAGAADGFAFIMLSGTCKYFANKYTSVFVSFASGLIS